MSNFGSIITTLIPEVTDIVETLVDIGTHKKSQDTEKTIKTKPNKTEDAYSQKNKSKRNKNKNKVETKTLPQKDICEQDCICEDIKTKNSNNKAEINSLSSQEKSNRLRKYIIYGEILSTPVCKRNRH